MHPPVTELTNRDVVSNKHKRLSQSELSKIIDMLTDDMRDLIQMNREYAIQKYGTDKRVDEYACTKLIKKRLLSLGYTIAENGGYINE